MSTSYAAKLNQSLTLSDDIITKTNSNEASKLNQSFPFSKGDEQIYFAQQRELRAYLHEDIAIPKKERFTLSNKLERIKNQLTD